MGFGSGVGLVVWVDEAMRRVVEAVDVADVSMKVVFVLDGDGDDDGVALLCGVGVSLGTGSVLVAVS